MMFLQYAVWGMWLPVLGQYLQASPEAGGLGFTGGQVGMILGLAGSLGAVSAPFIAGQLADRYFSTEKFLGVLLIPMLYVATEKAIGGGAKQPATTPAVTPPPALAPGHGHGGH